MSKRKNSFGGLQNNFSFFIPFTWYFVVFAVCCFLGYRWLMGLPQLPDTAYADILPLLVQIAVFFVVAILSISLLTVLASFLYFLYFKEKKKVVFSIVTRPTSSAADEQKQAVQINIHPILQPFLGFVKLRLQYDAGRYSGKFSLVEQTQKQLVRTAISGVYYWKLPQIKEYRIEKAIIYFEDFFQFFSLALPLKTSNRFYTHPPDVQGTAANATPRKTEDTNTRIDELKRVEGEYVNYKHFEGNDDVRRIVWKIYAKNKDLVVRVPEVLDPYASHIYLYASFFAGSMPRNEVTDVPFLNYYKSKIWNLYRQLVQQGFDVRYIADQPVAVANSGDAQQVAKFTISTSGWHAEQDLKQYVHPKDAALVVVSSLSDADEVAQLAEKYGNEISFVFVQLTNSLHQSGLGDWLQWLFVENEKDTVAEYRRKWNLSFARNRITQNEKQLREILAKHEKAVTL